MICNQCGFIILDNTTENDVKLFYCQDCSMVFCSNCIQNNNKKCVNRNCNSDNLTMVDPDLDYLIFSQEFRHIKKGGFG